ncbi:hypothetical protein N9544_07210 [Flavobacteriales bacterium]|nr:hypothetical protein [Flavobacteriales bacterium]
MKNVTQKTLFALLFISFTSCSQDNTPNPKKAIDIDIVKQITPEPHRYGGWYCPDNLNGFPPVDIANWKNVPVINGRLASKIETQTEASLIFVDTEKYPSAKVLDMSMPKLAKIYNRSTNRNELIILIQALNISNDSIVGFRYINGGNGSARLHEVTILSEEEAQKIQKSKFVSLDLEIDATEEEIWDVLKNPKYSDEFQLIFDKDKKLKKEWRKYTNLNYQYNNSGKSTASFADRHYGNYYIQNDYNQMNYSDKLFLSLNQETNKYSLKIVCGPFADDYETQKAILIEWSNKVKVMSEKKI